MPSLRASVAEEILVDNLGSAAAYVQGQLYTELCFHKGFWVINYDTYFYSSIILNFNFICSELQMLSLIRKLQIINKQVSNKQQTTQSVGQWYKYFYFSIFCNRKTNTDICRCCYEENGVFAHCKWVWLCAGVWRSWFKQHTISRARGSLHLYATIAAIDLALKCNELPDHSWTDECSCAK
jgi:hypothetical protein